MKIERRMNLEDTLFREWDARLMMERSLALKSPSIHYHLAGTKKVIFFMTMGRHSMITMILDDSNDSIHF